MIISRFRQRWNICCTTGRRRWCTTPDLTWHRIWWRGALARYWRSNKARFNLLPESQRGEIRSPFHYRPLKMENRYSLLSQLWRKDFMEQNKKNKSCKSAKFPHFHSAVTAADAGSGFPRRNIHVCWVCHWKRGTSSLGNTNYNQPHD